MLYLSASGLVTNSQCAPIQCDQCPEGLDDNPIVSTPDMTCACVSFRQRYTVTFPAHTTDFDTTGTGSCAGSLCDQFSGLPIVLEFIGGTEALMTSYLAGIYAGGAGDYCGDGPNAANVSAAITDGGDNYYYWAFADCYCGWDGGVGGETYGYHAVLSIKKDCASGIFQIHDGAWVNNAATSLQTIDWKAELLGGFVDLTSISGMCTGDAFTLTYDGESTFNPVCSVAGPLADITLTP